MIFHVRHVSGRPSLTFVFLLGLLLSLTCSGWAQVSFVANRADLKADDSILWSVLGPAITNVGSSQIFHTVHGQTGTVYEYGSGFLVRADNSISGGLNGNFTYTNEPLIYGSNGGGVIPIYFDTPVAAVGAQVETNVTQWNSAFTVRIEAYDKVGLLGQFVRDGVVTPGNDSNTAPFLGIRSTRANISFVLFRILSSQNWRPDQGLAINTVSIAHSSSVSLTALDPTTATDPAKMALAKATMRPSLLRFNSFLPDTWYSRVLLKIAGPKNTTLRVYVQNPPQGMETDDGHAHTTERVHGWLYAYKAGDTKWKSYPAIPVKTQEGTANYSDYDSAGVPGAGPPSNGVVTTDKDGNAYVYYTAPSVSGYETVTASTVDPDPTKRQTADLPLLLQMPDFAPLEESAAIELTGQTGNHPDNHYGTATMNKALQALAKNYAAEYQSHNPPTLPSKELPVNDMSLPWGGLYDIGANWASSSSPDTIKPGHIGHRRGIEADIGGDNAGHGLVPGSQWAKTFENILNAQGWWLNSGGLWNSEKPPHYHILLNGHGKPYVVFPDTVKAMPKSQGLFQIPMSLLNRGGVDVASLTFTPFTFTNGVTLDTSTSLVGPALPIQSPSTYTITVKVPVGVKTFTVKIAGKATVAGSYPDFPLTASVLVKVPQ